MMAAKFLCFLGILTLFLTSEAYLVRRKDPANPRSIPYKYSMINPEKIHQQLLHDLINRQIVEFRMVTETLKPMLKDLLDLLPKIPSKVMHPGTRIRMTDIRLVDIMVSDRNFKVLRVGNITSTLSGQSFSLCFNAPILTAGFTWDGWQREQNSSLPCTLVYNYENIEVNLKIDWTLQMPYRILQASILNAVPGSIRTEFRMGNGTITSTIHKKGSPWWHIMVNDAKSLIPLTSRFNDLVKTFATRIFT